MLINNAGYNFNQYYYFDNNNFFNINFDDILFRLLFTIVLIPIIGVPLAIAGAIFGGMIKEAMREKSINEFVDKLKYKITEKDYILNIKNTIIQCLEETDKRFSDDYIKLNILILGQTGVGKRSLINALVGHKVEETGISTPIAGRGIFPHETSIDGKDVIIYNSYWLELDKYEVWERRIRNELYKRGTDKDIKDWFHIITYCIDAGGGKIQDFDIKMIKQFLENKYNVVVVITKADQINNEDKKKEFIEIIKKETGVETVIAIAADPQKYRGMTEAPHPFGLYEYKNAVLNSWKKIFIDRVPLNIIKKLEKDIDKKAEELQYIKFDNEYFNNLEKIKYEFVNFLNEKLRYYVLDSIRKYYTHNSIDGINKDLNRIFDSNEVMDNLKMFSFAYIFREAHVPPMFILPNLLKLPVFNIGKDSAFKEFIKEYSDNLKKQINSVGYTDKRFENQLRDIINNILIKIEEEQKNKLSN
uniref:GTPase n=1 Tax=Brachyspira catarrhinii TaxID=2528966 RepID=UPI003F4B2B1F